MHAPALRSMPANSTRREWLRVGGLGCLGLSLGNLLDTQTRLARSGESRPANARSCIVLFLSGGPPQHETFDPKPDAPEEVRGPFKPIDTNVAGIQLCELLPKLSRVVDRLAIIRSLTTGINAHASSGYSMLTGYPHPAGNRDMPASPTDWPSVGAMVGALAPPKSCPLTTVTLPERIVNNPNVEWPGQRGGFMGPSWEPFLLACDSSADKFRIDSLALPEDVSPERLGGRRGLVAELERSFAPASTGRSLESYDLASSRAFDLLTTPATRAAFDVEQESAATRDRYGRHKFGQSVLLARRLVEAGVRLVQVNFPREPGDRTLGNPLWDTHSDNAGRVKTALCPKLDDALPALLDDLATRGLLDETLVVVIGEFGRSPKINKAGGRDHWGACFSVALAGAGIRGGTVLGASDRQGGLVAHRPVRPDELTATIFERLGIAPSTMFVDRNGQPRHVSTGQPIGELT